MCSFNLANVKNSWTNKESKQSEKQPLALEDGADESKSGDVGSTWRSNLLVSRAQAAAVSLPTPCQLHRHSWNQSIPPRPVTLEMLALERAESRPQPHPGLPSCGRRLQRLSLRLNTHIGVYTRARTRVFLLMEARAKYSACLYPQLHISCHSATGCLIAFVLKSLLARCSNVSAIRISSTNSIKTSYMTYLHFHFLIKIPSLIGI